MKAFRASGRLILTIATWSGPRIQRLSSGGVLLGLVRCTGVCHGPEPAWRPCAPRRTRSAAFAVLTATRAPSDTASKQRLPLHGGNPMQELVNDPRSYLALAALVGLVFAIGRWVGEVNSDRKSFKEFMAEMRRDMRDIHRDIKHVLTALGRLGPSVVGGTSPLRLTELGKRVSRSDQGPGACRRARAGPAIAGGRQASPRDRPARRGLRPRHLRADCRAVDGFDAVAYEGRHQPLRSVPGHRPGTARSPAGAFIGRSRTA